MSTTRQPHRPTTCTQWTRRCCASRCGVQWMWSSQAALPCSRTAAEHLPLTRKGQQPLSSSLTLPPTAANAATGARRPHLPLQRGALPHLRHQCQLHPRGHSHRFEVAAQAVCPSACAQSGFWDSDRRTGRGAASRSAVLSFSMPFPTPRCLCKPVVSRS